jgi:hypothetical protein
MSPARRLLAGLTPRYAFLNLDNYSRRLSMLSRFCLSCRTFAQNARSTAAHQNRPPDFAPSSETPGGYVGQAVLESGHAE